MVPAMNDATTTARDDVVRRRAAADDPDAPGPEPHAETEDSAPEEAGYGYGV